MLICMIILQEYVVFPKLIYFEGFFSEHLLVSHWAFVVCATQFEKH